MKQLSELTGMSRQAIHFYIKQGLVPPPLNRTRTSAEYTDEHVERIRTIRRMRDEQFLPLAAIRASLDERDEGYTPAQRRVIAGVRAQFGTTKRPVGLRATFAATTVARRTGVSLAEIQALADAGLVEPHADARGGLRLLRTEVWLVELWAELSALGFGGDDGFSPKDLVMYSEHIDAMLRDEVELITKTLADRPPAQLAKQVARVSPLISSLVAQLHSRALKRFLASLADVD